MDARAAPTKDVPGTWFTSHLDENSAESGLFPMCRHLKHGVMVALGSDVDAGTGFSLRKEGLQVYFHQQLLGPEGLPLRPAHLLHLVTRAGALARVFALGTVANTAGVWIAGGRLHA